MFPTFSIFIPVYRESDLLRPLLERLIADPYKEKEIFVVIDEPTIKSLRLVRDFASSVYFIWNGKRKGKANVLNDLVTKSKGEVLLFLDSDVLIDESSKSFLHKIAEEIADADIVEMKKKVLRDSFVARLASYDYLSFSFTSWFFSRRLGKCLGINGAAFAIRREAFERLGGFRRVVVEDLDIATRAFIEGLRYKFVEDISVSTKAPSSWSKWFEQRKRWGIGGALWFKEYFDNLIKIVKDHPGVLLPCILFIFPSLPFFLFTLFMPDDLYIKALYLSMIVLSTQTSLLLPPIAFTSTSLAFMRNLFLMVGSIGAYTTIFYVIARKLGFIFNPVEFMLFYIVYSPLWLLIIIVSLVKVYVGIRKLDVSWKI
ncbi:glycosyltransferase family 2 protein [Candidatus Bathyarchaeota archaeon]|nr:MAG: glycosyltransferase family 2 protein [Candidatus Bathyarchaeota archaeon]